jgi:hypothetical protein
VTMGVASLLDLFGEPYYTELEGGILEAFGKLFTKDLRQGQRWLVGGDGASGGGANGEGTPVVWLSQQGEF